MSKRIRGAVALTLAGVALVASACATGPDRPPSGTARSESTAPQYVIVDAVGTDALIWETTSNRMASGSSVPPAWADITLRDRFATCLENCRSIVFTSDVAGWRQLELIDSDPSVVRGPNSTSITSLGSAWPGGSIKRRLLLADGAGSALALSRQPDGSAFLHAMTADSADWTVPVSSPFVSWSRFPDGNGGLVYERGRVGGQLLVVTKDGTGAWTYSESKLAYETLAVCGAGVEESLFAVTTAGLLEFSRKPTTDTGSILATDLDRAGECYRSQDGTIVVERSHSSQSGFSTAVRKIEDSGRELWRRTYDSKVSLAASPATADVYIISEAGVARISDSGDDEPVSAAFAGVGFNRSGELLGVSPEGRVSRASRYTRANRLAARSASFPDLPPGQCSPSCRERGLRRRNLRLCAIQKLLLEGWNVRGTHPWARCPSQPLGP